MEIHFFFLKFSMNLSFTLSTGIPHSQFHATFNKSHSNRQISTYIIAVMQSWFSAQI